MVMNDPLANVLSQISNYEQLGRKQAVTKSNSKFIQGVLKLLQENGYLGSHEVREDGMGGELVINLIGAINRSGVIKPRYNVVADNFEKYEKRYLPAKGFGIIILSTNKGLMTHVKAKEENIGGRLVAYCY